MATKTPAVVPQIGNLLRTLSEKHAELPKPPRQEVRPVETVPESNKRVNTLNSKNNNTSNSKRVITPKDSGQDVERARGPIGRPSVKDASIPYVKLGASIPEYLRLKAKDAVNHKQYRDSEGRVITTLDELVTHALEKLFAKE